MAAFNRITIVGYLGRDPELRYTPEGTPVCSFSIATNERWKDRSGEQKEITTWFNVSLWRNAAERASQYLHKGSLIYLEGRLRTRDYQDRDGHTRTSLDVTASDFQFIGPRVDDSSSSRDSVQSRPPAPEGPGPQVTEDDIPF